MTDEAQQPDELNPPDHDSAAGPASPGADEDADAVGTAEEAGDGGAEADAPSEDPEDEVDWEALAELDERTPGALLAELSTATAERDGYLDGLQRKQAEFDNFRKRMQRDSARMRVTGRADVAERMLDVLDDFDRTIDNAGEVDQTFLKGVTLVHDKLIDVLEGFGLARIDDTDVDFDPSRHEAVQRIEADEALDEPRVAEVYRPGYELDGRVLRPAMVVVRQ